LGFRPLDSDTDSYSNSNSSSKRHAIVAIVYAVVYAVVEPGRQLANTNSDRQPPAYTKAQD
jgi:hypothetical protein